MNRKSVGLSILALAAAAGALLWFVGGRMAVHQVETAINETPGRVFDYLTQPELLTQWMGGLVESIPVGDGRLVVGARSREVIEDNGRRFTLDSEVVGLEPGRLLAVSLTGDMFDFTSRYRLDSAGPTTRVHHTLEARYKGITRLFAPFLRGAVQRKLEADLARLKEAVEGT
jgi:uncharacterized protein YndB with AHSA1/START domain